MEVGHYPSLRESDHRNLLSSNYLPLFCFLAEPSFCLDILLRPESHTFREDWQLHLPRVWPIMGCSWTMPVIDVNMSMGWVLSNETQRMIWWGTSRKDVFTEGDKRQKAGTAPFFFLWKLFYLKQLQPSFSHMRMACPGRAGRWKWPKSLATLLNFCITSPISWLLVLGGDAFSLLLIHGWWVSITCTWKCPDESRDWGVKGGWAPGSWQGLLWTLAFLAQHPHQAVSLCRPIIPALGRSLEASGCSIHCRVMEWVVVRGEGT